MLLDINRYRRTNSLDWNLCSGFSQMEEQLFPETRTTVKKGMGQGGEMKYVSDCCGAGIKYGRFYILAALTGNAEKEVYCTKCNKPCTPVEQKSGGEEEVSDE